MTRLNRVMQRPLALASPGPASPPHHGSPLVIGFLLPILIGKRLQRRMHMTHEEGTETTD